MLRSFLLVCLFATQLSAQNFYDRSTIQKIEIFFAGTNWDAQLDAAVASEAYVLADSIRINGTVFDSVGVKYKGNSSYNANNNKNPLHIELDHIHDNYDYQGYTDIKLQNGYQDPSMIREVLSYAILEQYMDCPQGNFANVYINGTLRGLYSNAENINAKFCGEHFFSSNGVRIKGNPVGGAGPGNSASPDLKYIDADTASYASSYEVMSDFGWTELVEMIDTLNNHFTEIETVLDTDRAIWMLAYNNVLVNLDSYSGAFRQNYYLYQDLNDRFVPIVWDLNMSFDGFPGGAGTGTADATLSPLSNATATTHPLIVKILGNATYKRMYLAHLRTILQENFVNDAFLTEANALRTLIDASVQADPFKFYTYTQFQNGLTTTVTGGGGPGGGNSIPGIQQLMDARVTFLQSNTDYNYSAPSITNVQSSNANPIYGENVTITANCTNENTVFLGVRGQEPLRFNTIQMFDDGNHNDGAANDDVYGASLTIDNIALQYYIYAENANAGIFSPQRAEHEYYTLNVVLENAAVGEVVINEIMASNSNTATDSNNESDDWIELYNNSDKALSLSNLFLTDDIATPNKWAFPAGAAINAHDVLIVWVDSDPNQSGLHTNFKLTSAGETINLNTGVGGINLDEVTFGAQMTDISYARCPNGTGDFVLFSPSYNAINQCVSATNEFDAAFEIKLYPVPTNDRLFIASDNMNILAVQIVDMLGRTFYQSAGQENIVEIPTAAWPNGWYVAIVRAENGQTSKAAFIKK